MWGIKGIAEKVMKLSHPVGFSIEQGRSLGRKMQPTNLFKEPFGKLLLPRILKNKWLYFILEQSILKISNGRVISFPQPLNPVISMFKQSQAMKWRRQWHPTPVLLPGKSHGRRSLVGCSPRGLEESDRTERLHFHFSLSLIGEGNGNPLQCSCLENPRDGGA